MTKAIQERYQHVRDQNLLQLARAIPEVKSSKAENTQKKYNRGFNLWYNWAIKFNEVKQLPASSLFVPLFFLCMCLQFRDMWLQ